MTRTPLTAPPAKIISERLVVFLIGAVQFVNILDFVMVTPLGPFYAEALAIPEERIGWVVGAYTIGGALSGFAGSFFLDRFDRRRALAVAASGLALGTLSCAFAVGLWSLIGARFLAGAFGGPATSIAMAIVADLIPPERRGRAMGAVAGAFSVATVVGVPAGLLLARHGGWRQPFVVVAALGAAVVVFCVSALPRLNRHIDPTRERLPLAELLSRPTILLSYGMTAIVMFAGFVLIPNFPAYIVNNLGYPRDDYPYLYLVAGVFSFVSLRIAGRAVDRLGSFKVGTIASAAVIALVWAWLVLGLRIPVLVVFIAFMTVNAFRNVSYNTLTSKVPRPQERARFMSIQSTVQLAAMGFAAILSGFLLSSGPGGKLVHMPALALLSMAMTAIVPFFLYTVERRIGAAT